MRFTVDPHGQRPRDNDEVEVKLKHSAALDSWEGRRWASYAHYTSHWGCHQRVNYPQKRAGLVLHSRDVTFEPGCTTYHA